MKALKPRGFFLGILTTSDVPPGSVDAMNNKGDCCGWSCHLCRPLLAFCGHHPGQPQAWQHRPHQHAALRQRGCVMHSGGTCGQQEARTDGILEAMEVPPGVMEVWRAGLWLPEPPQTQSSCYRLFRYKRTGRFYQSQEQGQQPGPGKPCHHMLLCRKRAAQHAYLPTWELRGFCATRAEPETSLALHRNNADSWVRRAQARTRRQ